MVAAAGAGVAPAGLGARDTLRLEAGMNLYGHEMDDDTSPLQANLAWTIAWQPEDRDFVGRAALVRQRADGVPSKLVGLVMTERGVLRAHQPVRGSDVDAPWVKSPVAPFRPHWAMPLRWRACL